MIIRTKAGVIHLEDKDRNPICGCLILEGDRLDREISPEDRVCARCAKSRRRLTNPAPHIFFMRDRLVQAVAGSQESPETIARACALSGRTIRHWLDPNGPEPGAVALARVCLYLDVPLSDVLKTL
jgi:hypothetical protein